MSESSPSASPPTAIDLLVEELLGCGAVLSQIVSGMLEFEASGRAANGLAPIPEIAHGLIVSVLQDVRNGHSRRDIRVAATIVGQVTEAIAENIFAVSPEFFDELKGESGS